MTSYNTYKIYSCESAKIYVGCTKRGLRSRLGEHRRVCVKFSKFYGHMREIGRDKFKIELLENRKCDTKEERQQFEQEWIDRISPELNSNRAYLSPSRMKEYSRGYRQNYIAKYPGKRCLQQAEYRKRNLLKIRKRARIDYHSDKNPDVKCKCGGQTKKRCFARHLKSTRHKLWLENKNVGRL